MQSGIMKTAFLLFIFLPIIIYCQQNKVLNPLTPDTTTGINRNSSQRLKINSYPTGATVYVNDKEVGLTPLEVESTTNDSLRIEICKRAYENWHTAFILGSDKKVVMADLIPKIATIDIIAYPENSLIYLDNSLLPESHAIDRSIQTGNHKIIIKNDSLNRMVETSFTIYPREQKFCIGEINKAVPFRGILNLIIPGGIQIYDGYVFKGLTLLTSSVILGIGTMSSNKNYKQSLDKYNAAIKDYNLAYTEAEGLSKHNILESSKIELDKKYNLKMILFSSLAAVYIYSLVDAFLNHIFTDQIEFTTPIEFEEYSGFSLGAQLKIKL